MVGIVLVSHSHRIAEGAAELAREMGGPDVLLETAGGLDTPDHAIGTDAMLVMAAIERAWTDDGVLVLMDLGSAVLSAEMALDLLPPGRREFVLLCEAPFVEGAVSAAVTAKLGAALDDVAREARAGLLAKATHLGIDPGVTASDPLPAPGEGAPITLTITVGTPHGLHARPAAKLVQVASGFDARVEVRNVTNGKGPASGSSLNAVATLGAAEGHRLEFAATGAEAAEAIEAIEALAARNFDERATDAAPAIVEEPVGPGPMGPGSEGGDQDGRLRGHPASPGIAIGAVRRTHPSTIDVPTVDPRERRATDDGSELAALDAAIEGTRRDIRGQRDAIARRAGAQEAEIFDAHLLFLRDEALLRPTRAAIEDDGLTAAQAWHESIEAVAAAWGGIDDAYLAARAADLRSVGDQVLAHLLHVELPIPIPVAEGILVAPDLTPADTAALDPAMTLGIATARGGPTSHAAVLARSLGIPAVVGLGGSILALEEGVQVGLDGDTGELSVDPDPDALALLHGRAERRAADLDEASRHAREPAITTDGIVIEVAANVGGPKEVSRAVEEGADAVGLFRTEFLFMDRPTMPDEDEQDEAYRAAARALDGRPLLLRTLDAGADKPIAYLDQPPEANPFLGVRGVRLGLARPELLLTQLRAVLRVAGDHPVRVMFPMIATIAELDAALGLLRRARQELGSDAPLETGVMVEVPSTAILAPAMAERVDFLSIGTNDLTQYTLAADRGNEHVAALSDPVHPAVLRLIAMTVEGARVHGRWVGICGELAGMTATVPLLLGLGVRELSMSSPSIAPVKRVVRAVTTQHARGLALEALSCPDADQVRALLGPS